MKLGLIRVIIAGVILCIISVVITKSRIDNKKQARIFALIIMGGLMMLSCVYPIESAFLSFSSPESAYYYSYSGDIQLIMEGQNTVFVVADESESIRNHEIIPKKENQWGVCVGFNSKIDYVMMPTVTFIVYEHRKSGDCYICVESNTEEIDELYDNLNSVFYSVPSENDDMLEISYYAYVEQPDSDYCLTLNGVSYQVFE